MLTRRLCAEVEKQLQEGGAACPAGTPQMSLKKAGAGGAGGAAEGRAVQMRRPTNRRGKQAPTPPKRTRYAAQPFISTRTYLPLLLLKYYALCVPRHVPFARDWCCMSTSDVRCLEAVLVLLQPAVVVQLVPRVAVRGGRRSARGAAGAAQR